MFDVFTNKSHGEPFQRVIITHLLWKTTTQKAMCLVTCAFFFSKEIDYSVYDQYSL